MEEYVLHPEAEFEKREGPANLVVCHVGNLKGEGHCECNVQEVFSVPHNLLIDVGIVLWPLLRPELDYWDKVEQSVKTLSVSRYNRILH